MHILATPIRKEMEPDDIEDGEILEDESTSNDQAPAAVQIKNEQIKSYPSKGSPTAANKSFKNSNNFDNHFHNDKSTTNHPNHHESHLLRLDRRERFSDMRKKRKRVDSEDSMRGEKYYGKRNKCEDNNLELDEEMIFMLGGGSHYDNERKLKYPKARMLPDPVDELLNPTAILSFEGENEDPRPYARRSPPLRRDKLKKDRLPVRGGNVTLLKRRGRGGGAILRKERLRESINDISPYYGADKRGGDLPYQHYSQPRKLEICKFYLADRCFKREKCIYMHEDFPCKYHHTNGLTCYVGNKCKYHHGKLDEVQRAVLKKYADITLKEMEDMQKFYRESGANTYANRFKEKLADELDPRIPSLLNLKLQYPNVNRRSDSCQNENKETVEGDGASTPIPSPQSMMYENVDDFDDKSVTHSKHTKNHQVLLAYNDFQDCFANDVDLSATSTATATATALSPIENDPRSSHHKKKRRKSDESDQQEKTNKKHSEKRKKRSKKDDDKDKEKEKKKKKKEHKRNKHKDASELADSDGAKMEDDAFDVGSEDAKMDQMEHSDAWSHLPKKQQELFLRIQQHQKEAESNQNSNVSEKDDEDEPKPDENWYSSDEEQEQSKDTTVSPLATLLKTIQSSTNAVTDADQQMTTSTSNDPVGRVSTPPASATNDAADISVDPSQLANISLSDEFTKILSSIIKPESSDYKDSNEQRRSSSSSSSSTSSSSSSSSNMKHNACVPKKTLDGKRSSAEKSTTGSIKSSEDVDYRFTNPAFTSAPLFGTIDTATKDIDLRQLPFKPIPIHDAANEIDASIMSHPPIEYKLIPLPFIPRVNYAALTDIAKNCPNDPRFKRKSNTVHHHEVHDVRHQSTHKASESTRTDPRLASADSRSRQDPRLDNKMLNMLAKTEKLTSESRSIDKDPRQMDYRDPRLSSRAMFPEMVAFMPMPQPPHMSLIRANLEDMMPRKKDPRLRFRAHQNE